MMLKDTKIQNVLTRDSIQHIILFCIISQFIDVPKIGLRLKKEEKEKSSKLQNDSMMVKNGEKSISRSSEKGSLAHSFSYGSDNFTIQRLHYLFAHLFAPDEFLEYNDIIYIQSTII